MNLTIKRREFLIDRTIGDLYIDGKLYCQTMEDVVRASGIKIQGETAIPAGRYEVRMTYSNRFKQVMPQIMNVPNFEGIRIHPGNGPKDTEGCILLGKQSGNIVTNSRDTYNDLMDLIDLERSPITLTIINQNQTP